MVTTPAAVFLLLAGPLLRGDGDPLPVAAAVVEPFLKDKPNTGVVVGVYRGGVRHVRGFGVVHTPGGTRPPAADTLFAIGSITKPFTGILLADAVRRGEVKLDAPVNDYLPADLQLAETDPPITLEHLATHHSGLPANPATLTFAKDAGNPYADFDRAKLSWLAGNLKGVKPGVKYVYSNLGAGLVGHALVHAAKAVDYDSLLKTRVCFPLGLKDTGEALTGDQLARFARGHTAAGEPRSHWDFATLSACGGLKSTANDLLLLSAAMFTGVEPLAASTAPRADAGNAKVGLFWMTTGNAVWHNGATTVTRTMLFTVPEAKCAVVVLMNRADAGCDALAVAIARAVTPLPAGK